MFYACQTVWNLLGMGARQRVFFYNHLLYVNKTNDKCYWFDGWINVFKYSSPSLRPFKVQISVYYNMETTKKCWHNNILSAKNVS